MHSFSAMNQDEESHLRRNRACLECKRRKVKCDGVRPVCLPCTRLHQAAQRAAGMAEVNARDVRCSWADHVHAQGEWRPGPSRKKVSTRVGMSERPDTQAERVAILEAERESFVTRLAQLETRLAALTSPSQPDSNQLYITSRPSTSSITNDNHTSIQGGFEPFPAVPIHGGLPSFDQGIQPLQEGSTTIPHPGAQSSSITDLDLSHLFVVPNHWPQNLPAPYLLEHLVETFFNCVPHAPRMLHRAKLLRRLHLPPKHPQFPLPALLHAICAAAAGHTAWVISLPPQAVYGAVNRLYEDGKTLEDSEDFGLSQAEASRRAYHEGHHRLWLSQGDWAQQNLQAQAILMGVWHSRGMFGAGGVCLGDANRLIKELEFTNRIHRKDGINSWINPPDSDVDREERLGTVWQVFIFEAFSAVGSYWTVGLDDRLLLCSLPAGCKEFSGAGERIQENPQDARDPDLFTVHPIADPYVLACKTALLCARVRRTVREWTQRRPVEGDKMLGMESVDFQNVYRDLILFQQTLPDSIKHIFRLLNAGSHRVINYSILAVHLMPHLATLMLHEPFVDWNQPNSGGLPPILKAIDGVMGVLHLIPSNFNLSLGMTGDIAYNLQVCAQFINQLIEHAVAKQAYAQAIRYRTDFTMVKDLLKRLGTTHAVAYYSAAVLEGTLQWRNEGFSLSEDSSQESSNKETCSSSKEPLFTPSASLDPLASGVFDPWIPAIKQTQASLWAEPPQQDPSEMARSFDPLAGGSGTHLPIIPGQSHTWPPMPLDTGDMRFLDQAGALIPPAPARQASVGTAMLPNQSLVDSRMDPALAPGQNQI